MSRRTSAFLHGCAVDELPAFQSVGDELARFHLAQHRRDRRQRERTRGPQVLVHRGDGRLPATPKDAKDGELQVAGTLRLAHLFEILEADSHYEPDARE
jgi:hypothetical protein